MHSYRNRIFVCLGLLFLCLLCCGTLKAQAKSLKLTYDGKAHTYKDVQGKLYMHHKDYEFQTLPLVKLKGYLYAPAKELLETALGFDFSYNEETKTYIAIDEDISVKLSFTVGEKQLIRIKNDKTSVFKLPAPILMVQNGKEEAIPCIPVSKVFSALEYEYDWQPSQSRYKVYRKTFFKWTAEEPTDENKDLNRIHEAKGKYAHVDHMAYIDLYFYGDRQKSFDSVSVDRNGKTITVTLPESSYLPNLRLYDRFGEIVERMVVSEADGKVQVTFYCESSTEFTYASNDLCLHLRLMWDYSTESGKTSDYSLSIPRPDKVLTDSVSQEDCYDAVKYTKAFKIIIKGDYVDFYKKKPVIINNNMVKKVQISLSKSGNTIIRVATKKLQGYKIERVGKYFGVTMGSPRKIYKNILVFDCGHGGYDSGAVHDGHHEKYLNLKMGYKLLKPYFTDPNPDIKVYWTRRTDKFITLDTRAKFASKVGADAFISLHMNSAANTSANGTEVYYSVNNNKKSSSGLKSSEMAARMDSALTGALGTIDRGVRTAGFYVIKENTVPAILIEMGFLSGNKDHKQLIKSSFQKKATQTVQEVIRGIFSSYPSKR